MAKLTEVQHIFDSLGRPYPKQSLTADQLHLFPYLTFDQPHPGGRYRCVTPYKYGKPIALQPQHVRDMDVVSTETLDRLANSKASRGKSESKAPQDDAVSLAHEASKTTC